MCYGSPFSGGCLIFRFVPDEIAYDIFLSHGGKNKVTARPLAERLRAEGVRVLFDEWVLEPSAINPAKIEEGWSARALVLCMPANAYDQVKREAPPPPPPQ